MDAHLFGTQEKGVDIERKRSDGYTGADQPAVQRMGGEEEEACRYCFDGEEDSDTGKLFAPCMCKGTIRLVHPACLEDWRTRTEGDGLLLCGVCGYRYRLKGGFWARGGLSLTLVCALSGLLVGSLAMPGLLYLGRLYQAQPPSALGLLFFDVLAIAQVVCECRDTLAWFFPWFSARVFKLPPALTDAMLLLTGGAWAIGTGLFFAIYTCIWYVLLSRLLSYIRNPRPRLDGWRIMLGTITAFKVIQPLLWLIRSLPREPPGPFRFLLFMLLSIWSVLGTDYCASEAAGSIVAFAAKRAMPEVLPYRGEVNVGVDGRTGRRKVE